jgi:hypothetical protein
LEGEFIVLTKRGKLVEGLPFSLTSIDEMVKVHPYRGSESVWVRRRNVGDTGPIEWDAERKLVEDCGKAL